MAAHSIPQNCVICKEDIRTGQRRRVVAIDQSEPGGAPRNVYAHWDCTAARGFTGCFLLRPGQNESMLFAGPAQLRLEVGHA